MHETILALARALCAPEESEAALLELLCTAAEQSWSGRLREGLAPEGCNGAYPCACALSAAAELTAARGAAGGFSAFRAGEVSVTGAGGESAAALHGAAARLMAPYVTEEGFAFVGVRA